MRCVICFNETEMFLGRVCILCVPEWWANNKNALSGTGCVVDGCRTRSQNSYGMCKVHNLVYWQAGGKTPGGNSRYFQEDGSRVLCSLEGCEYVSDSLGLCRYHYQNRTYANGKGLMKKKKYTRRTDREGNPLFFPCDFDGCDKPYHCGDLCAGHYYQRLRGENLTELHAKESCAVPNCEALVSSKLNASGICTKHRGLASRFSLSDERLLRISADPKCENPGCGSTENLQLDHDHSCCPRTKDKSTSCGECVRGWLCRGCNLGLGMLQENPRKIQGLLDYVARF